jgi:tetratricopeptide (TPR) repeat protein
VVSYGGYTASPTGDYGTIVIRTPDVDDVDVAIDGSALGKMSNNSERTVKVKTGLRKISLHKGNMHRDIETEVNAGRSKIIEVNLSFTESDEQAVVEPTAWQTNVFLREDKEPNKEAKGLFLKGVESFNKQKFEDAIASLSKAAQANNGAYAEALVYRGRAEQSLGRKEAAVASFSQALALRPSDFETRTLLAEAKFNAGYNVVEVVNELREIISRHPNFEFAHVVLGDLLFWRGDLIGAERQLKRAILINPQSPPAHMILADVLTYQNALAKQREAITAAEKALQLFQEVSRKQVSVSKGLKYLSLSHIIFGGARYINAAAMAEAHHILAKAITRLVERDETLSDRDTYLSRARTNIDMALKLARSNGDKRRMALVLDTSALCYLLSGNVTQAIAEGEQALKISETIADLKNFPDAHYTLYSAYSSDQKFKKAADHLQKFIEAYGTKLTPQERQTYEEELNRLKRAAAASRQK